VWRHFHKLSHWSLKRGWVRIVLITKDA